VRRGPVVTAAIAAAVVAVDQASKSAARTYLAPARKALPVLGELLRLTFTRNTGAAFGMLQGGRVAFVVVSIAAVLVIAGYVIKRRPQHPWLVIALGLVAAGAIGNAIDRAFIGWVTDFIQVPFGFPVFNVADSAVVVGTGMLVWWLLFGPGSAPQGSTTDTHAGCDAPTGPDDIASDTAAAAAAVEEQR
jgi:signal peptidase II